MPLQLSTNPRTPQTTHSVSHALTDPRIIIAIETARCIDVSRRLIPELAALGLDEPSIAELRKTLPTSRGGTDASPRAQLLWEEAVQEARKRLLFRDGRRSNQPNHKSAS